MISAILLAAALQSGMLPRLDSYSVDDTVWPMPTVSETSVLNDAPGEVEVEWSDGNTRHVLHVAGGGRGWFRLPAGMAEVRVTAVDSSVSVSHLVGERGSVLFVAADGSAAWRDFAA